LTTTLPHAVHELLENRIDSFEKLELVLALAQAPRATLSIEELSRALTLSREDIRQVANELRGASLVHVTTNSELQLLPPTQREHTAIEQLVAAYREDRFAVVQAMAEISLARIRGLASRAFADAFIIGKKPKKGGSDG